MDIEDLLTQFVNDKEEKGKTLSRAENLELLEQYKKSREKNTMQPGDIIERNEMGKKRYKLPNGNDIAMCLSILDKPLQSEQESCDMMVLFTLRGEVRTIAVDSSYYQKAEANTNVFSLFNKNKH